MEKYRQTIIDSEGNIIPLATVNVYDTGTENAVSIFSDDGVTSESNPFTTGTDAVVKFYAADGRYDVKITKTGFDDILVVDQQLFDRNITGATGGLDNTGSTTVGAGSGDILFKIAGSTIAELKNNKDWVYNTDHLFLDFSTGFTGIKNSAPGKTFDVTGEIRASIGILFGSDTAAANTLNDYEEGSWTPTLVGSTGGSFGTSTAVGWYTVTGQMVFFGARVVGDGTGSPTGNMSIGGLPFTSSPGTHFRGGITVGNASSLAITAGTSVSGYVNTNATTVALTNFDVTGGTSDMSVAEFTNNGDLIFNGFYRVP